MTNPIEGLPELQDACTRVSRYLARREESRGIDREHIHCFDSDKDLLASDVQMLLDSSLAALATRSQSEPIAWALQWPSQSRLCLSTVFDTEIEAKDYAETCHPDVALVPLYSTASTGEAQ